MSKKEQQENDDIVIEDINEEAKDGFGRSKKEKKAKDALKTCHEERQEYLEGWQRAKADLVNFKKEIEENRKNTVAYAQADIIEQILPVLDSFDMAFRDREAWEKGDPQWRTGVEYIHTQLVSVLESNGVTQIDPSGMKFDPQEHEPAETVEVEDKKQDDQVLEVLQKGYKQGDRLLRPARVKVGDYKQ